MTALTDRAPPALTDRAALTARANGRPASHPTTTEGVGSGFPAKGASTPALGCRYLTIPALPTTNRHTV